MGNPLSKITDSCKALCQRLLDNEQPPPEHTLFGDDIFETTCSKMSSKNESRVIRDISQLLVPSAESLANYGASQLDILLEEVNSSWLKCLPLIRTRPQPGFSVGFADSAFTEEQLERLSPLSARTANSIRLWPDRTCTSHFSPAKSHAALKR